MAKNTGGPSQTQRKLARLLLAQEEVQAPSLCAITQGPSGDAPLSTAQSRLFALQSVNPQSCAYSTPIVLQLSGHLDLGCLQGALNTVVSRHDVLRTCFPKVSFQTVQRVLPEVSHSLTITHLTPLPGRPSEAQVEAFLEEQASLPFHLETGPLLRVVVVGLGAQEHLLLLVVHQIICDVPSRDNLLRELFVCYEALRGGSAPELPAVSLHYADYARWELARLEAEGARALQYWKTVFARSWQPLRLPTRSEPSARARGSAFLTVKIPSGLTNNLQRLAAQQGTTLYGVLLTAYACLLREECEQGDLVVFSPFQMRDRSELESMLGLFVNQVPLRLELEQEGSFRDFLGRVSETVRGAFEHQVFKLGELIDLVSVSSDGSRRSLFQTTFTLLEEPPLVSDGATFEISPMPLKAGASQFELCMAVVLAKGGAIAHLEYRESLFERSEMERLLKNWLESLAEWAQDPDQLFSRLEPPVQREDPVLPDPTPVKATKSESFLAMAQLWAQVLGVAEVGPDEDFFALGGHSLTAARLVQRIQDEFEVNLPPGLLLECPTVATLHARLETQISSPVLVTLSPGDKPPLFVVPGGWGGVLGFLDFARAMPSDQPVLGLDFEGTQASERERLEDVAEAYVQAIRRRYPQGPYHLMGFSFGGPVAYEMALRLDQDVSQLIILDSYGPDFQRGRGSFLKDWASKLYTYLKVARLATLGELKELLRRRLALGFEKPGLTPEIWLFLQHARSAPGHIYKGSTHLLRYSYQPRWVSDPTLGWSSVCPEMKIHEILGTHGSMSLQEPVISRTAELVRRLLDEAP